MRHLRGWCTRTRTTAMIDSSVTNVNANNTTTYISISRAIPSPPTWTILANAHLALPGSYAKVQ